MGISFSRLFPLPCKPLFHVSSAWLSTLTGYGLKQTAVFFYRNAIITFLGHCYSLHEVLRFHSIHCFFFKERHPFYFLNNSVIRQRIWQATSGGNTYRCLYLAISLLNTVTTLIRNIRNCYSISLQHTCASRCSHSEWQNIFWLGIYGKL